MARGKDTAQINERMEVDVETKPEVSNLPAPAQPQNTGVMLTGDDAAGFEGMTQEDFNIPFLALLQKGSPQVDEDSGARLEGAKAGMFFNTVTQELYDGKAGVVFVPCHRDHQFVEWIPRDEGGGFVASHKPEDPKVVALRQEQGKFGALTMDTEEGQHDLVETFYVYGLLVKADETYEYVVIAFKSTQIKTYKNWMTMARAQTRMEGNRRITVPLFGHRYRLSSIPQQKKEYTYQGMRVTFDGANAKEARLEENDELYQAGKSFRDLAVSGVVKADMTSVQNDQSQGDTDKETF